MATQVWIRGLGSALPKATLTNEEIESGMPWLDTSAEWIAEHTGIRARRVADAGTLVTDLGFQAAEEALGLSGMAPADVDLVLLATNTSEHVYPAGAARIQQAFGVDDSGRLAMADAGALDLQQGCSSFVGGMGMASGLIRGGLFGCVLVVGADIATRMLDWTDRNAVLLGDGACAAVLTGGARPAGLELPPLEVLGHFMRTDPTQADAIRQRGVLNAANNPIDHIRRARDSGGDARPAQMYGADFFSTSEERRERFFAMEGREVFRFVKRVVPRQGYLEVIRRSGFLEGLPVEWREVESIDDLERSRERRQLSAWLSQHVDLLVPHGANLSLVQELADEMQIPWERVYVTLQEYANTSAASVGISLYEALRQGVRYSTLTKRDGAGEVQLAGREIDVPALQQGQKALLLSFGAGNSWNYLMTRRG